MLINKNIWTNRLLTTYLFLLTSSIYFVLVGSRSIWLLSVILLLPFCFKNLNALRLRLLRSYPILLILIWCFISSFWSSWPEFVRVETVFQVLIFFTALFISELYSPEKVLSVLRSIALLCISLTLISLLLSPGANLSNFVGIYPHKNTTGQFLALSLLILIFSKVKMKFTNIAIYIGIILLLISRSSTAIGAFLIALIVGNYLMNITHFTRQKIHYFLSHWGYFILFSLFTVIYIYQNDILNFIYNNLADETLTGRGNIWKIMLYHADDKILTGFGYASVWWHGDYSEIYFTDIALTNPEWVEKLVGSDGGYIDIVLSIGLIGLFMFVTFLYTMFLNLLKAKDPYLRAVLFSLAVMILILGVTESIFFVPQNLPWFLLLLIFCLSLSPNDKVNYVC